MHDDVAQLAGAFVTTDHTADQEFEARLVESSTLAFRVAYSVLRQRQDAEDVAQEAFVKAYRSFTQLRDRERFRAWLVRITWRLALDRQRGDRRRTARESSPEGLRHTSGARAASGSPDTAVAQGFRPASDDQLIASERAQLLWKAIDALPEKLRVAIVLASIEGHDVEEVARLLEVPAGTIKSRLFDARKKLKESLQWMQTDPANR